MSQQSIPLSELESSPAAKWNQIGDTYRGRITSMVQRQQTNTDGAALSWNDGSPRMLWVITIEQTNGESVALYAKGGKFRVAEGSGDSMLNAIGAAVRAAGAQGVDMGADLAVAFTGMAEATAGKNAAKLYTAQYRPAAAPSVPVDMFTQS